MERVPIQRNYVVLGGLATLATLAAVLLIPYHRHVNSTSVRDLQEAAQTEQAAPVLSVQTDGAGVGTLMVDGQSLPLEEGTRQISTPNGTAIVTVSGDDAVGSTRATENTQTGNVNISVTTENSNSLPNSSVSSSFSQSSSSSHVSSSSNVSVFGTSNGNGSINVQVSK